MTPWRIYILLFVASCLEGCTAAGYYLGGAIDSSHRTQPLYQSGTDAVSTISHLRESSLGTDITIKFNDQTFLDGRFGGLNTTNDSLIVDVHNKATQFSIHEIESIQRRNYSAFRKIGVFVGAACDITAFLILVGHPRTVKPVAAQ